jgi:RNA polymerase sigma-70 factor (ECF subfamily)
MISVAAPSPSPALVPSSDAPAFDTARLYRDYAAAVARWASKLTRSSSEAEDVVQEVFLVAHRRLPDLPPLRNPAPWLFRITTNVVRHRWRDQRRRMAGHRVPMPETAATGPSPLEVLERNRQIDRLERAMSTLHAEDRRLLWLCDVRCLPTSRVTAMTGIKPETLRVRRFRARAQIARQVQEQTGERPGGDPRAASAGRSRSRRARPAAIAHRG